MTEQAPEPPAQAGAIADPDKWISQRSRETGVLVQMRKRELLKAVRDAADPEKEGELPPLETAELMAIDRLETKLASRARVAEAREMTRAFRGAART